MVYLAVPQKSLDAVVRLQRAYDVRGGRMHSDRETNAVEAMIEGINPRIGGAIDWKYTKQGFRVLLELTEGGTVGFLVPRGTNHAIVKPPTEGELRALGFQGPALVPMTRLVTEEQLQKLRGKVRN